MSKDRQEAPLIPLKVAVLTVSDSRSLATDRSGQLLQERIGEAGHTLAARVLLRDDIYQIRAQVSQWLVDDDVQVIIINGGTGITGRDGTPEAVRPLLERIIDGFGELFRQISYSKIKTSAMASRALAGTANGRLVFCIPGSPGACEDAWDEILVHQLDSRYRPCNLAQLLPRLLET